jgi:hypothetical protein
MKYNYLGNPTEETWYDRRDAALRDHGCFSKCNVCGKDVGKHTFEESAACMAEKGLLFQ